ncbi:MAG TPA: Crp/Fnr family transcriptional regulator [Nitrososphaerales archaeon]|nr:Crp/Fnr family transcriptional regulator [Nitrososphaerales archaeon]
MKDDPQIVQMLQQVPLFSALNKKQLKTLVDNSSERRYDANEVIEREGDMGVTFYLILNGSVEVRKGRRNLAKLGRGQFFGEMALIDKQPRSATVVALEPTSCMLTTAWNFRGFLDSEPKMALALLREMARRLRETNQSLSE